ncbi:MAG: hypothetical protein RI947_1114 [Candidatus Parcubacteria bacterium]|jgi:prepilin signal peptidase PulO-like enzyme (type II secretory pathway)
MTLLFIFIIGLAIGSFSNVLIDRLPNDESIMGRSHCDFCNKTLTAWELIPILSFIIQKRRCKNCGKKLSFQYPIIELWTGVLFVLTWLYVLQAIAEGTIVTSMPILTAIAYMAVVSCLNIIFITDAKYQIIPDSMQIALLVCSVLLLFTTGVLLTHPWIQVLAGICTLAPILALHIVTRGRGMGFGDVKFAFIMGLLLGIGKGFLALYIGFIVGAIVGVVLMTFGTKKLKSKIAFGPFLVIGLMTMLIAGDQVLMYVNYLYK